MFCFCISWHQQCINHKPKTRRQNTIIEHTASRIALNNQLEVFIKVKQATNADFSFLNPPDKLHRYYLHTKEKFGNNNKNNNGVPEKEGSDDSSDDSNNPLSGLLGDYDSSSDDEDMCSTKKEKIGIEPKGKSAERPSHDKEDGGGCTQAEPSPQDRKRKAERLERLRVWKETRLKQSDNKS
mmetsp:Transcript_26562/g.48128  ORF Transcript_26562/g.48128 Transcript_26562/m.48128 type:complete len:182 (-) Transcript_26562:79-624(-)